MRNLLFFIQIAGAAVFVVALMNPVQAANVAGSLKAKAEHVMWRLANHFS